MQSTKKRLRTVKNGMFFTGIKTRKKGKIRNKRMEERSGKPKKK